MTAVQTSPPRPDGAPPPVVIAAGSPMTNPAGELQVVGRSTGRPLGRRKAENPPNKPTNHGLA